MFSSSVVRARYSELGAVITAIMVCAVPFAVAAQSQQPSAPQAADSSTQQQPNPQFTGSINGTVVDQVGAVAVGAMVQLTRTGQAQPQRIYSGNNGEFSFADQPPGPFQLTVSASGFTSRVFSAVLNPGQSYIVPDVVLNVASATTNVDVGLSTREIAQAQVKQEEKQRVLGIVPNFYVTYLRDAAPLGSRQKFSLAWKSVADPITLLGVGALAGIEQATDDHNGFGQGAQGYGKRFGAAYATLVTGTFISSAILPSLMKQDPRYFYQGTGSKKSRLVHALSNAVIRKGDDGQWQPNYSGIIGSFASAGISYAYYPASDRSGGLLAQNALLGIAGGAVAGVFQEFVLPKFTSHFKDHPAGRP